jgi:hypothetical protein
MKPKGTTEYLERKVFFSPALHFSIEKKEGGRGKVSLPEST